MSPNSHPAHFKSGICGYSKTHRATVVSKACSRSASRALTHSIVSSCVNVERRKGGRSRAKREYALSTPSLDIQESLARPPQMFSPTEALRLEWLLRWAENGHLFPR